MTYIIKSLESSTGSNESQEIKLVANTENGVTQIEVTKTITERFSLKKYKEAQRLYDMLNENRRVVELEDLLKL